MTKRKVFISHAWEDNEISRQLAEYLKRDGADIWIDYSKIHGGDSLPRRISEALDWCDTLILLWSKSAINSYYRHHLDEKTGHLTHKKTGKSKIIGQAKRQDFKKKSKKSANRI